MAALFVYILFGLTLAWRALPACRTVVKCWLGLVFAAAALMWLPCIFAIFLGFTLRAQLCAMAVAFLGTEALVFLRTDRETWLTGDVLRRPVSKGDAAGLLLSVLAAALCAYLLYTHVLLPHDDGSLWVGQSTYGDLAMHLGFIEGLYRQGDFPPEYSIYPGQLLDYPFLVDAASASLRFFGMSLRMSVIVPSLFMLFCVFLGFWLLADRLTGRLGPTVMAWLLFVFNGGFGFLYFLAGPYEFSDIFTGYYTTPTNLTAMGVRWVNVICDMLIPQRTTMAGWCAILPGMYLLMTVLEKSCAGENARRETVLLGVLAGAMPMIHTHSFLALGVLSAVWFFAFLPKAKKAGHGKALLLNYVLYGVICFALALPQLIVWTFQAASTGNLLWWNPGWVAEGNWLGFWTMNCGVVFILMWPMLFFLRGDKARLYAGAAAVFLLANLVAFQPNPYDDNKLLYIWYMLTDIMVCGFLWDLLEDLRRPAARGAVAAVLTVLGTFSGVLTVLREAVSEYQLLDAGQVAAAQFALETPADSVFLTGTGHANPISILAGRDIVCGPGMYLYYHGVDYEEREKQVKEMYRGGAAFERYAAEYGVDYVYVGSAERAGYAVDMAYFEDNWPVVFRQGNVTIFQIS